MALISCKECKKEVSDLANSCPHCGYAGIQNDKKQQGQNKTHSNARVLAFFFLPFGFILWVFYSFLSKDDAGMREYSKCIEKGKLYFSEIGSYPKLSDGRDAGVVAAQRCANTVYAFDGLSK